MGIGERMYLVGSASLPTGCGRRRGLPYKE
jgi:hypothetical protein